MAGLAVCGSAAGGRGESLSGSRAGEHTGAGRCGRLYDRSGRLVAVAARARRVGYCGDDGVRMGEGGDAGSMRAQDAREVDGRGGAAEPSPAVVAGPAPRVDSAAFSRARGALEGTVPLAAMSRLLATGVAAHGELDWSVSAHAASDALGRRRDFLDVAIEFAPTMPCARCLEPVELAPIRASTRFRFAATERQAEIEDREESDLDVLAHDTAFDLAALVEDEAILSLPMVAAHAACPEDAPLAQASSSTGGGSQPPPADV